MTLYENIKKILEESEIPYFKLSGIKKYLIDRNYCRENDLDETDNSLQIYNKNLVITLKNSYILIKHQSDSEWNKILNNKYALGQIDKYFE